jgi:hypothetical protein
LADPIRKPLVAGKEKIAESRLTIEVEPVGRAVPSSANELTQLLPWAWKAERLAAAVNA